ncbi:uncharacterized protein LOC128033807 [Gossypium raimondii]|uniref:uncharacterized protein LOC128033807 n=1 Tax=Gossypium raimondii TaxID=29730 RepID=UPI00227C6F28|nr:uncharacterized protein LOC128033807 [Gossypium raimondii]
MNINGKFQQEDGEEMKGARRFRNIGWRNMTQTMAFITIPRPLSLLASSTKDSWSSASVHCSYSKKSSRFSTNSRGLNRDCKAIFWNFGSFRRQYLSQLTAMLMTFKDDGRDGSEAKYDREFFSKLLFQVPISEMKFLSKLAFLCNIAYVIPKIEVCFFLFSF